MPSRMPRKTPPTTASSESAVQKAEDVVSSMLAKGFVPGKDTLSKAKTFDEKLKITSTATSTVSSFDKKIGLSEKITAGTSSVTEKVKETDQRFQVSKKTESAFAAAEQTVSSEGSAILKNRPIISHTSQASIEDISGGNLNLNNSSGNLGTDLCIQKEDPPLQCTERDGSDECYANKDQAPLKKPYTSQASTEDISVYQTHPKTADNLIDYDVTMSSDPSATIADCNVSNGREESVDVSECLKP
ncbi:hypothetical protein J5N97_024999 [Dioscorea zingiberensis]|uniref:Uncharacterized protein n=1 Tax=Dioscorea zingiberensis TaxID=325984 RepID=A0A9D5C917_9LILI|nr:hypothetical protein J5N97_024999 [Dioscorea zingiberensis]